VSAAYLVLLVANLVFSTGYAVTRVVLNDVGRPRWAWPAC